MHAALTIAGKDLRQRFRDRSAIVLGFVAPLAIALLMSLAFRGAEEFHMTLGAVDGDRGPIAAGFVQALDSPELRDVVTVRRFDDRAAADAALRGRGVDAALVIPAGFSAAATGSAPQSIDVLTSVDAQLGGQVARSIVESFVAQLNADRLSVATAIAAGASPAQLESLVASAASLRLPVQVASQPAGTRPLKAITYYAPAMGIFFVFFAISFTARGYFVEQREGTLERMAAAVPPGSVLLGKALAVFVYGTASLATMATFTSVVFGADWGGPLLGGALCLAMVASVVALTSFVITLARTERQAESISAIVVFGLALLGGNFVFISAAPELLRRLALFTPNGWALRGFVDVATGPHALRSITMPLLGMVVFTAAVAFAAALLSRRMFAS